MAFVEVTVPALGEGIFEVTIIKWLKNINDTIDFDETLVEIATDKVDTEITSPAKGKVVKINFSENSTAEVGSIIAIISTDEEKEKDDYKSSESKFENIKIEVDQEKLIQHEISYNENIQEYNTEFEYYSPLVKEIAKKEKISFEELRKIKGTSLSNRITKNDIFNYLENRDTNSKTEQINEVKESKPYSENDSVTIIEMDRMRKLIAEHMVNSKRISPHVTSFIETDATRIVFWREKNKEEFSKKHNQKLTYTHIILECIKDALKEYPRINSSLDNDKIIEKKNFNIGIATALPSGNLIVPVIHNCNNFSIKDFAFKTNDLADRARNNKLLPHEIQQGTFTVTNIGTFGNIAGTPIINQPQVAILALGAIVKKPAVISTEYGDTIGIKNLMILSLSYDHRIVDGALGGLFLQKIANNIENFDISKTL